MSQVMPYSTGCTTVLSNMEAGLNYKDVSDPAIKVSFPLDGDPDNAQLVIWTTTPWYEQQLHRVLSAPVASIEHQPAGICCLAIPRVSTG